MHWQSAVVRSLLAMLCLGVASRSLCGQQDDPALRERFLKGIQDASRKVERISFRAKCIVSHKNLSVSEKTRASYAKRNQDPHETSVDKFENAIRGPFCWQRAKGQGGSETIKARNGSYAFAITRNSEGQRATLRFLEEIGVNPVIDSKVADVEKEVRGVVLEGFYLSGTPLVQLVQSKDFRIQRAYAVSTDGNELVRVEFDYEFKDPQGKVSASWTDGFIVCDPTREWAMVERGGTLHTPMNHSSSENLVKFEYGDSVAGIPVAKTVEITSAFTSDPGSTVRTVHSIEVVSADEVPEEEFYLSHYGLPEPNFSRSVFGAWAWYLIGGAVCLGIGAILIKRRKARA